MTSVPDLGSRISGALLGGALSEAAAGSAGHHFASATQLTLYTTDGITDALEWANDGVAADETACLWLAYLRWLGTQGEAAPRFAPAPPGRWIDRQPVLKDRRDPDAATLASLLTGEMGSRQRPLSTNDDGAGALKRSAPLGLLANVPEAMIERLALDAAAITHGSPAAQQPAAVFTTLIRELAQTDQSLPAAVAAAASHAARLGAVELSAALAALRESPAVTPRAGQTAADTLVSAISLVLRTANDDAATHLCALLAECATEGPAHRVGAAIAGNIVGALHGSAALPAGAIAQLKGADVVRGIADRFSRSMGV